ncbi:MAG: hypothetical protein QNL12_05035 [Acidimicrobiia bacterium]|nr:hypothetical protein [Acidimicrobiia bacterium]MDX2466655.1 hypothetical protein [Acidimicrobiia bacterium]
MTDRNMFPHEFPPIPLEDIEVAPRLGRPIDERTYEHLVLAAFSAALTVLLTKIAATLLIANMLDATVTIQFFLGFLPYFGVIAEPATFASIVTFSTIAMITASLLLLVRPVLQVGWSRQRIWGRGVGLAIGAETFFLEALRHWIWPSVLRWDWAWLAGFELILGLVLLATALKQSQIGTDNVRSAGQAHVESTEDIR